MSDANKPYEVTAESVTQRSSEEEAVPRAAHATWLGDPGERKLDEKEAATYLGLKNHRTLSVWRSTRRQGLRYYKVGRRVVYRLRDLDAFLAEHAK